MLICENPLKTVLEGFSYLSAEYDMYKAHEDNDDWFCDQENYRFSFMPHPRPTNQTPL